MNLQNIMSAIEETDPEVYQKIDSRRNIMKSLKRVSGKIAVGAVPVALASVFQKAYGRSDLKTVIGILNFALTLEYIESEFYKKGVSLASSLIPEVDRPAFETINMHEKEHVKFLTTTINALHGTPVSFAFDSFDYTAKGNFPGVFTDYATFLAVSQTFEDTGVRAYKGQAPNLVGNEIVLTAALRIHSVEARHASHLRKIRGANGLLVPAGVKVEPWITLNQSGIDTPAVQASYDGEEVTNELGVETVHIGGYPITDIEASQAFDEPLNMDQVLAIVTPFFA